MIEDVRSQFAAAVALNTGGAGTYQVGDTIDLSVTGRDLGAGSGTLNDLYLVVLVSTTATSGGSATTAFALGESDTVSSGSLSSPTVVVQSPAIPVATLVAGYQAFAIRLPARTYKRYIGLLQIEAVAALTAGAVNAFLTPDLPRGRFSPYPQGIVG